MGVNQQTSVPAFTVGQVLTAQQQTEINTGVPVFADTTARDAAFGGSRRKKVLAEGQMAYLEQLDVVQYYDGAAWAAVGPSTLQIAVFNETQAANTNGGTSASGSFIKRTLNTTVKNDISGCSIASSVITLPAGTYYVIARAPTNQTAQVQAKIRNTTDGTDLALSGSGYNPPSTSANIDSTIQGFFVLAASKRHRTTNTCEHGPCN
jgi:hypothetical protein